MLAWFQRKFPDKLTISSLALVDKLPVAAVDSKEKEDYLNMCLVAIMRFDKVDPVAALALACLRVQFAGMFVERPLTFFCILCSSPRYGAVLVLPVSCAVLLALEFPVRSVPDPTDLQTKTEEELLKWFATHAVLTKYDFITTFLKRPSMTAVEDLLKFLEKPSTELTMLLQYGLAVQVVLKDDLQTVLLVCGDCVTLSFEAHRMLQLRGLTSLTLGTCQLVSPPTGPKGPFVIDDHYFLMSAVNLDRSAYLVEIGRLQYNAIFRTDISVMDCSHVASIVGPLTQLNASRKLVFIRTSASAGLGAFISGS